MMRLSSRRKEGLQRIKCGDASRCNPAKPNPSGSDNSIAIVYSIGPTSDGYFLETSTANVFDMIFNVCVIALGSNQSIMIRS